MKNYLIAQSFRGSFFGKQTKASLDRSIKGIKRMNNGTAVFKAERISRIPQATLEEKYPRWVQQVRGIQGRLKNNISDTRRRHLLENLDILNGLIGACHERRPDMFSNK
jgi:hypothetical protein